jgi:hypothetical protein
MDTIIIQIDKIERVLQSKRATIITRRLLIGEHGCSLGELAMAAGIKLVRHQTYLTRKESTIVRKTYGLFSRDRRRITETSDNAGGGGASVDAVLTMLRERMKGE